MSGMRILIVSDTHRRDGNFRRVLEKTGPIDMLIHLGDTEGSESYFREWVDNDVCVIHVVRGNNDFFSFCDREKGDLHREIPGAPDPWTYVRRIPGDRGDQG